MIFRFGRLTMNTTIGIKPIWAVSIISAAHSFDYIVLRVKFGLTSCEEFATPLYSRQRITKSSTTEINFLIVLLMLIFTTYHYWLHVYHRITNGMLSLRNKLKQLHSHKQYRQNAPLKKGIGIENEKVCKPVRNQIVCKHVEDTA